MFGFTVDHSMAVFLLQFLSFYSFCFVDRRAAFRDFAFPVNPHSYSIISRFKPLTIFVAIPGHLLY